MAACEEVYSSLQFLIVLREPLHLRTTTVQVQLDLVERLLLGVEGTLQLATLLVLLEFPLICCRPKELFRLANFSS